MSSRGWLLFVAMSIMWAFPYLMIKVAVEGVSVPVLVFARTAVGAAVLLPLALSRDIPRMMRSHWRALLGSAFSGRQTNWRSTFYPRNAPSRGDRL